MSQSQEVELEAPRFIESAPRLIAGFGERYPYNAIEGIPALWYRFGPHIGKVPHQVGHATYGLSYNGDESAFDYLAGVEVSSFDGIDDTYRKITVPAGQYAVFRHHGHVSGIRQTCDAIWGKWLPASGKAFAPTPMFELYGDEFDPATVSGIVELWCPLK